MNKSRRISTRHNFFLDMENIYNRHSDKALWVAAAAGLILLLIGFLTIAEDSLPRLFSSGAGGIFAQRENRTISINSFDDVVDAVPGDGVCETAPGKSKCTLRAAIQEANMSNGETILNLPAGTYVLTLAGEAEDHAASGDLDINAGLSLVGAGMETTIIEGNGLDDVISVKGEEGSPVTVLLTGFTVRNGVKGIYAEYARLDLDGIAVEGSTSTGVEVHMTDLFVARSLIQNNQAGGISGQGGAGGDTMTILTSQVIGNSASEAAVGGIRTTKMSLSLTDSTVSNNLSNSTAGVASDSSLTIDGSTISFNKGDTGGVYSTGETIMINSTISGNKGAKLGGMFLGGKSSILNCTISSNQSTATSAGGFISGGIFAGGEKVYLSNTILQGNISALGSPDCGGSIRSAGYNLIGTTSNCAYETSDGDQIGVDPLLSPLSMNGGKTWTHAPGAGSPVINAGNPSGCVDDKRELLVIDQRGADRAQEERCDIGAFETGATLPVLASQIPQVAKPVEAPPVVVPQPVVGGGSESQSPATTSVHDEEEEDWQPPPYPESWIVQAGEFPACLAARFNVDLNYFISYNKLGDDPVLQPGQVLLFPPDEHPYKGKRTWKKHPAEYQVEAGEDLFEIACKFGDVKPEEIAEINGFSHPLIETVRFSQSGQVIQIP